MAENKTFRSAFNGFNREDVVRYIEYINNQHTAQVSQLNGELEELRAQVAQAQEIVIPDTTELEQQMADSEARCAALEAELAAAKAELDELRTAQQAKEIQKADELEAYRRAERAERMARERVDQLYAQANGALAEATTMVDQAASQLGVMANDIATQMNNFRDAVIGTKSVLADAATTMYAIRPCADEQ